jgi:hypothetical protein
MLRDSPVGHTDIFLPHGDEPESCCLQKSPATGQAFGFLVAGAGLALFRRLQCEFERNSSERSIWDLPGPNVHFSRKQTLRRIVNGQSDRQLAANGGR